VPDASERRVDWIRILIEVVVIVFSVLLALALDAWWADVRERAAERQALSRLRVEFSENRERALSGPFRDIADASATLYALMQDAAAGSNDLAVPDTLLAQALGGAVFDPVTPVLDGLIRSGQWEIIRDHRVRDAISTWERWLAQLADYERERQTYADRQLRAAPMTRGDVAHVLYAEGGFDVEGGFDPPSLDPDGATTLCVDSELRSLVAEKQAIARSIVVIRQRVASSADSVLVAISNAQE